MTIRLQPDREVRDGEGATGELEALARDAGGQPLSTARRQPDHRRRRETERDERDDVVQPGEPPGPQGVDEAGRRGHRRPRP
jgi:hypothetical protein